MSSTATIDHISAGFTLRFPTSAAPVIVRSPGRINIIGEHTDYNNGFVLPTAIDKDLIFAMSPNDSSTCTLVALDLGESETLPFDEFTDSDKGWVKYLAGAMDILRKSNQLPSGFDCVFGGDIPLGAGLSSSAALCCGFLFGLNELFNLGLTKKEIILKAQETEQHYVGLQCGIMDQYASVFSKSGNVLKIDCESITHHYVQVNLGDYEFLLINSGVTHQLAESEYNVRRTQCEEGVAIIRTAGVHAHTLRDVKQEHLELLNDTPLIKRRCQFVLEENQRVNDASMALSSGDMEALGNLLMESHKGLQHDYQVTCEETDLLVSKAMEFGSPGARQMGGGFGGCTLNLIKSENKDLFITNISKAYFTSYGRIPDVIPVQTAPGTSIL